GEALAKEMATTFGRHLVLPTGAATVLTLWTLHAHAISAAQVSPLLMLSSPERRCGKSPTVMLVGAVAPRPLPGTHPTPAVLYRAVHKYSPTLLVDEADTFLRDNDDLRGVVNSSHVRALASVPRCEGEDSEPRLFSTWCPKLLATIGRQHATLEDRAIVV